MPPPSPRVSRWPGMIGEMSGAFGDLGTFLPYVVAIVAGGILSPTPVFAGFAVSYLLVAVVYRVPVAVQPMKALSAMVIAGSLSAPDVACAGALMGMILLLFSVSRRLGAVTRAVPQSVVTGLQAGLGLILLWVAIALMGQDWSTALPAIAVLGLALVWRCGPWALIVVAGGAFLVPASAPSVGTIGPETGFHATAVLSAVMAQLPLTLLNAVVVSVAVARALFPEARSTVTERRLAATSGLLNVALVPFGALPMCHGAGGTAAHHRFGARGMIAPLILATLCACLALAGPVAVDILLSIPLPVVGALLAYAAVDLVFSRRMFDARSDCRPVIAATAIATFAAGAIFGLLAGLAAETLRAHLARTRRANTE